MRKGTIEIHYFIPLPVTLTLMNFFTDQEESGWGTEEIQSGHPNSTFKWDLYWIKGKKFCSTDVVKSKETNNQAHKQKQKQYPTITMNRFGSNLVW